MNMAVRMNTARRIAALRLGALVLGATGLGTLDLGALGSSALGLGALSVSACHRDTAQSESAPAVGMGTYRAVLSLPGGELPFGLDLEPEGTAIVGYLVNGKERVKLDEVTAAGAHLDIRMPGYENRLIAAAKEDEL